ncbi:MAG: CBS domain-containing protein [Acidobacteria bacterium]|nr:CBS domain-containing protein [Acidobacteriota bacterium]
MTGGAVGSLFAQFFHLSSAERKTLLVAGADGNTTVLDAGTRELIVSYPDDILHEAVSKMLRHDIGRLPVVDRQDKHKLIGYLGRAGVMAARLRLHEEEHVREQGLLTTSA